MAGTAELPGPDVVGLAEAASLMGIRPAVVRATLAEMGLVNLELRIGPVWATEAVTRAALGKTSKRKPVSCVGLFEAAEVIGIAGPNVRKWMQRRGLEPRQLVAGPVWRKRDVEAAAQAWRASRRRAA